MSSQYSIHSNSTKDTLVNFYHFESNDYHPSFITFEISNDNNVFKLFMNSGEEHLAFLTNLATVVQKEIEKISNSHQDQGNA